MQDFGTIKYREKIKAYILENGCMVPHPDDQTVPVDIHTQFDPLYKELDEYAKAHPDKVIKDEPTPEEIEAVEIYFAQEEAKSILTTKMQKSFIQTAAFSADEFTIMAKANLFETWAAGETYSARYRLVHNGIVYEVVQDVTAIENQPPSAEGMLAIYRPLSVDPTTGAEPDGSKENPFTYIYGMNVQKDKYYSFNDKLWLAKADMPACVWDPGTSGLWQWEAVNE